jgi:hypothetical protein
MKILLVDFYAKVERERESIFKLTIVNESLHQYSNDNGIRKVKSTTSKNLVVSTMFSHRNIHKYTWTSPQGQTHNQINHMLTEGRCIRVYSMCCILGELTVILITI